MDTNGPTAVVYLAQRLGISFTYYGDPESRGKGLNFAVSGAQTGDDPGRRFPTGPMLGFGMKNQVANFVQFSRYKVIPPIDPQNTLFFLAGGLNDSTLPDGSTRANIEAEIESIYELGGRRFMVALLPEKIPAFAAVGKRLNPELAKIPGDERGRHPDIRISNSRWGSFFDTVLLHPADFGISDTTNSCAARTFEQPQKTACPDPEVLFYYHAAHPSTATHRAVGNMLYREVTTEAP